MEKMKIIAGVWMLNKITGKTQVIIAVMAGIMFFYGGVKYQAARLASEQAIVLSGELQAPAAQEPLPPKMLMVHVVGAVEKPGIYQLEEGRRIGDAIQLAVPLDKADLEQINLAAVIQDGRQIYVPLKGDKSHSGGAAGSITGSRVTGKININTAGARDLDRLEGIGPALAKRIIEYRESKGPFACIEDITKVSGIGPAILEKNKENITADGL